MRQVNQQVLSGSDAASQNGIQIDANQLIASSFQISFGDALAAGTFKLQASNDVAPQGYTASQFVVSNWVNIPNQSVVVSGGSSALLTITQMAYRWVRAVYTNSGFFASKVIQDLTYTAVAPGSSQVAITIRYIGDGTAGAETVNVTGNAIVVHMDPTAMTGSTAAQIRTAVLASVPAAALVGVVVSGTGTNVQAVVAATPLVAAAGATTATVNMSALGM